MKRFGTIFLALMLIMAAFGCKAGQNTSDADKPTGDNELSMDIDLFSIGQADCVLLSFDGYNVMIDAGENDDGEDILRELMARNITSLDLLVLSHFDKDHIGGADYVIEGVDVKEVLMPDYERDSKQYKQLAEALAGSDSLVTRVSEKMESKLGKAKLELWPSIIEYDSVTENDNELSLCLRLEYGTVSMVFLGDAEGAWLDELALGNYNVTCDLMKMPCHGEWDSALTGLLAFGLPDYAVITDSVKNPAEEKTLNALKLIGATTLRTMNGNIALHCDGKKISPR